MKTTVGPGVVAKVQRLLELRLLSIQTPGGRGEERERGEWEVWINLTTMFLRGAKIAKGVNPVLLATSAKTKRHVCLKVGGRGLCRLWVRSKIEPPPPLLGHLLAGYRIL